MVRHFDKDKTLQTKAKCPWEELGQFLLFLQIVLTYSKKILLYGACNCTPQKCDIPLTPSHQFLNCSNNNICSSHNSIHSHAQNYRSFLNKVRYEYHINRGTYRYLENVCYTHTILSFFLISRACPHQKYLLLRLTNSFFLQQCVHKLKITYFNSFSPISTHFYLPDVSEVNVLQINKNYTWEVNIHDCIECNCFIPYLRLQ